MIIDPLPAAPDRGRRPYVSLDGWALKSNWRSMATHSGRARTGAAVKANGYGLGAEMVTKALFGAGCRDFFVAWADEGAELREAMPGKNYRIFVLQGIDRPAAEICRNHRLIPVLSSGDDIELWQSTAKGPLPGVVALQIESGMNRLGLDEAEVLGAVQMAAHGELDLALVMSHLACADDPDSPQNMAQLQHFSALSARFPHVARSLANSGGVYLGPSFHFDLTRPGIALYGGAAYLDTTGSMRPVATLIGHVLQVHRAPAGEAAGYGAAARLSRDTRIATVGLGYADGYPRSASAVSGRRRTDRAPDTFAAGRRCPVLGRISMDTTLIDVTDLAEGALSPGDEVEFFGPNIPIDEVAARAGTIAYELLTSLGSRVTRRWT